MSLHHNLFEDIIKTYLNRKRVLTRYKERYIKAWICATGIGPEDAIIVTEKFNNGSEITKICTKKDYERIREEFLKNEKEEQSKFFYQLLQ